MKNEYNQSRNNSIWKKVIIWRKICSVCAFSNIGPRGKKKVARQKRGKEAYANAATATFTNGSTRDYSIEYCETMSMQERKKERRRAERRYRGSMGYRSVRVLLQRPTGQRITRNSRLDSTEFECTPILPSCLTYLPTFYLYITLYACTTEMPEVFDSRTTV